MPADVHIRQAVFGDIPVLRELINVSVRGLQVHDYTAAQIESALKTVFGIDSQLIADGTYFVAEAKPANEHTPEKSSLAESAIVGCGGWSKRHSMAATSGRDDRISYWILSMTPPKFAPFSYILHGRDAASAA